jgi:CheY-like chemotaxis protein
MTPELTTLLIVDDEPGIRATVARWARRQGFVVIEAATAGEALDRMACTPATVALCDINLPDRNGMWLAAQLRRQFPDTALLMTTGYGITSLPSVLDADSIGCLMKPFTQAELMGALVWATHWHAEYFEARAAKRK